MMNYTLMSDEQEKKLLGMCCVIFPDYTVNITEKRNVFLYRKGKESDNQLAQHFHWIEFSMAVIPQKLFGSNYDRSESWYEVIELCRSGEPIIDALYSRFEELCDKENNALPNIITKIAS